MADQKISQLTGGGAAQATDEYVVARAGGNNKITGANVAAAATSVGTLSSLTVANTTAAATAASFSGNYNASGSVTVANFQRSGGAVAAAVKYNDATTSMSIGTTTAHTLSLRTNDTDRVTFDSSGNVNFDANTLYVDAANNRVGIGTASPGVALDVVGLARADVGFVARLGSTNSGFFGPVASWLGSGSSTNLAISAYNATGAITFYGGGGSTEHMRLDASGNLGLGVTPTYRMQVYSDNSTAYSSSDFDSARNLLLQNANTTTNANIGIQFLVGGNSEAAITAVRTASGEASLAFGTRGGGARTTRMTLDASGNLGVGETSPDTRVHVYGANTAGRGQLYIQGSSTISRLVMANSSDAQALSLYGDSSTSLVTYDAGSGYGHRWTIADGEKARITSGGDFYVNTTSALGGSGAKLQVDSSGNAAMFRGPNANNDILNLWNTATSGDNLWLNLGTEGTFTSRGTIDYNRAGGLTRYNTTSDYRAKDIIGPVQNVGETIDALKVYEGLMKGATESRPMLIAHEAQEHAPYAVSGFKDEENEDGTPKFQQMDVSAFVPLLIAEIQSLRARVASLEAGA